MFVNTHTLWLELHAQGDYKDYIEDDEEVKTMVEDIMNVVQENAQECKVRAAKLCFLLFLSREVSYLHVWELQAWGILWFHQGVLLLDFTSMNAVTFRKLFFNWFMRLITAFIGHLNTLVLILHKRNSQCNVDLRIVMRMLISWTGYYTDFAVFFISDPAINLFWLLVPMGAGCYRDICWFPQGSDISQPSPIYRSKSGWSCKNETTSYS